MVHVMQEDYEKVKGSYVITPQVLHGAKEHMIVLHPLPRIDEIRLGCRVCFESAC